VEWAPLPEDNLAAFICHREGQHLAKAGEKDMEKRRGRRTLVDRPVLVPG